MATLTVEPADTTCSRLSRLLVEAADIRAEEPNAVRTAASLVGAKVAKGIDKYWGAAGDASPGPVDVVDVFSGCGGMSAGFRAVNGLVPAFNHSLAIDIDEASNATYLANLGLGPEPYDIAALAGAPAAFAEVVGDARAGREGPLAVIGCSPCQGFSSHRNSRGSGDSRNSLFVDFARLAAASGADIIVAENVPELLTDRYWPYVEEVRGILEGGGYRVHVSAHNLAEFGVPQERFRALLLAMRRPFIPPRGFLGRQEFRTVRDAIGNLRPVVPGEPDPTDPMHYTARHRESTLDTIRAVPKDGGSRPRDAGPDCLRRAEERQGKPAYEDVYGRLAWDRPSVTITNYARNPASGRYVHPEQDRGLSVREAAMLQSFPSGYVFAGGLDPSFRQLGNAVPPSFAAYVACHVLGELLGSEAPPDAPGPGLTEPVGASFSRLIPALKSGARRLEP